MHHFSHICCCGLLAFSKNLLSTFLLMWHQTAVIFISVYADAHIVVCLSTIKVIPWTNRKSQETSQAKNKIHFMCTWRQQEVLWLSWQSVRECCWSCFPLGSCLNTRTQCSVHSDIPRLNLSLCTLFDVKLNITTLNIHVFMRSKGFPSQSEQHIKITVYLKSPCCLVFIIGYWILDSCCFYLH